jgi:ribosomal protein S18 acetylase RimI-like enzyme
VSDPILRPATADDVDAIAAVFHDGWHDVHPGRVPDGLTQRRTPEAFRERVAERVADTDETTVAEVDGRVAGFVMVHDSEAEQVYVDRAYRGTTVATLLLTEAERQIAVAGHDRAWLVVVRGNDRAQAFYARQGWVDEGDHDYPVTALGEHFISPCRRYTKRLD